MVHFLRLLTLDFMVAHTDIEEILRLRISDGTLAAGSKIPTERSLAEEFGASRNTIRKAIKLLEHDSLITTRANSRPVVVRHIGVGLTPVTTDG